MGLGTVVGLNLYPPSNLSGSGLWLSDTSGGALMGDALAYAGGYSDSGDSVPEGGGFLLSGVGLAGFALMLRRRRKETLQCESEPRLRYRGGHVSL